MLGKLLERNHEVEIIGPKSRGTVWEPVRGEFEFKGIDASGPLYTVLPKLPELLSLIDGDLIYAVKPKIPSYGISLFKTLSRDRPLVLDIDDWETGYAYEMSTQRKAIHGLTSLNNPNSYLYTRSLEALSDIADARTVSNQFLKNRFGGKIVRHVRDTSTFNPSKFDKAEARRELGLPQNEPLVMFLGTPLPHKGVDDMVRAVASLERNDARALVVGAEDTEHTRHLQEIGGDTLLLYGQQPFQNIPKWHAAADIFAIPQKPTMSNKGQLPAKVFDAMAMGKPIIATDISDLAEVLDGCGILLDPGDTEKLKNSISELLKHPKRARKLGNCARRRCVSEYSYDAVAPQLDEIVRSVI